MMKASPTKRRLVSEGGKSGSEPTTPTLALPSSTGLYAPSPVELAGLVPTGDQAELPIHASDRPTCDAG